jgi:AraC-like DNA-binding protein
MQNAPRKKGKGNVMLDQTERHFTVGQVAQVRNLSSSTVRRLFENEPGVVVISKLKPNKRIYRVLRIPESIERRLFARLTNRP